MSRHDPDIATVDPPAERGRGRTGSPLRFLLRLAVFGLILVCAGEIWFRTAMPAAVMPERRHDTTTGICAYNPDGLQTGLYTSGRWTTRLADWRVNNAGWMSAVDYVEGRGDETDLVAVFGDSYIEGFSVPEDEHVDAWLRRDLGPNADVYAFGASGWYLEEYVAIARMVRDTYRPDAMVFFVNSGDVEDSVKDYGTHSPYWYQIETTDGVAQDHGGVAQAGGGATTGGSAVAQAGGSDVGFQEVEPSAVYRISRKARLARLSAIVCYLRYNRKIQLPGMSGGQVADAAASLAPGEKADAGVADDGTGDDGAAGATADALFADERPVSELLPAARYMLDTLCREHPGVPMVFAADGIRYLGPDAVAGFPLAPGVEAIKLACEERAQCRFLDLRAAFAADYAARGREFEGHDGAHWSSYGCNVVARAVADLLREQRLL